VELPPLEAILLHFNSANLLTQQKPEAGTNNQAKQRGQEKRQRTRHLNKFRRIQNTHLFTADELRAFANGTNPTAS
ncbi:hypothetical protein ETH_00042515, partial [Eimeria tenella]